MRALVFTLAAVHALTGAGIAAQCTAPDPVPTRVATEFYGEPSGFPCSVELRCALGAANGPAIELAGGTKGALAAIVAGVQRASVDIPGVGTLLVGPTPVAYPGIFGADKAFALPMPLDHRELVGVALCLQGFAIDFSGGAGALIEHTRGLDVKYAAGTAQPALDWKGPDLTATLVRRTAPEEPETFRLLNQVTVYSTGWDFETVSITRTDAVTRIFARVVQPHPDDCVFVRRERLPAVIDLRADVAPRIEVWMHLAVRRRSVPAVFALAAVVERDF